MNESKILDPRQIIADSKMTTRQIVVIVLCIILNGLDGFDVLAVSYAAPGISQDWNIERAALGLVLSMELVGMALGSIFLGQLADRIGRRPTILLCLIVMACGMLLAALCRSPVELSLVRLVTGLGIGGMLASISALVAEVANARSRTISVALMAAGYPLGAVIGGMIASNLLVAGSWRDVFLLGAGMTAVLVPIVYLILPESIDSVVRRLSGDERVHAVNRSMRLLGHAPVSVLPQFSIPAKPSILGVFQPSLRRTTYLLIAIYFTHMMSFYYVLKWIPKIVADLGFASSDAAGILVWASAGGAIGSLLFSLLTSRLPLRTLLLATLSMSALFLVLFGISPANLSILALAAGSVGFFTNAAIVGLYAVMTASFPTHLRAGGTGLVIGLGRGGAAIGPVLAGILFSAGFGRESVAIAMASGSLLATLGIIMLFRIRTTDLDIRH